MLRIYILLPVHDRLASIERYINSLLAQTYTDYHLILIDDGSTEKVAEYVRAKVKDLSILTGRGDWWWGGSLHQGYCWLKEKKVSAEDIVLMSNNDTEFGPDFFQKAVDILSHNPKTLLLPKVYSKQTGKCIEAGVHVDWRRMAFENTEDPEKIGCLSTRGLFFRVGDFMDIGGFHPVLLPHYLSDCEFTIRAHRKGYKLMVEPFSKLVLDESTIGIHVLSPELGRAEFFREYFSKRYANNPVYWLSMVALACPWPLKMSNFLKIIYEGFKTVIKKLFGISSHQRC